jgi:hypothetical protein
MQIHADDFFIEVDHHQLCKYRQPVGGDVFLSRRIKSARRIVTVLSDGLGSGVKANVLATLTSTMALEFATNDTDLRSTAQVIMDTLPVCSQRKVAYSTFTIVDIEHDNSVRIIEHDNPPCLVLRQGEILKREKGFYELAPGTGNVQGNRTVVFSQFQAEEGDRVIFFSDGVSQSGMGRDAFPLGWGLDAVRSFAMTLIQQNPAISARELARQLVEHAALNDENRPKDDITCGVVYFRHPRRLLVVTGPPFSLDNDKVMADYVRNFNGRIIVSGGTTASIVARELGAEVRINLDLLDPEVPPISHMEGIDLVTEGTITLAKVTEMLERGVATERLPRNGATMIMEFFRNSDIIEFLVGTRINEAHQDPNVPMELDLRRTLMKRLARLLEEKYLKETRIQFI